MGFWCIDCNTGSQNDFDIENMICRRCGSKNITNISGNMKIVDIITITHISKDKAFLEEMSNLHATNIIEYESRMSHFRTQTQEQQNKNIPRCPTCGSANIEKISATSKVVGAVTFGLFSKTARSQFKCKNCGAKW